MSDRSINTSTLSMAVMGGSGMEIGATRIGIEDTGDLGLSRVKISRRQGKDVGSVILVHLLSLGLFHCFVPRSIPLYLLLIGSAACSCLFRYFFSHSCIVLQLDTRNVLKQWIL